MPPTFSDSLIDEIRNRADLVDMVAEFTTLKRSGKTFRGPCPLHGGKGPNFSVDPARNVFKCFVCGEGGDVFSFPMKHLGMDFLEAVRYVAERAGVEIPEPEETGPRIDPNDPFYEVNAFAADWFRKRLHEPEEGRRAREYLEGRGIGAEAVERFGLGWAPEEWTAFGDAARRHGISNELLLQVGLVKESKSGGRDPYDAFRGRIVFPIEDLGGRVLAFGGRILERAEEHVPKYLNSPESPIYHKGDVLYGLGWSRAAIRRAEVALVVEGYIDYVSLAAHGIENVLAPLGTAMTERQAELLARYAPRVVLLYDSDAAGLKATFRSGDELLRAGVEVAVATLPPGEDPDSLVRSRGAAELQRCVREAVDVLERKIQILERRDYFGSIAGIRRAVDALLPTLRAASDEVTRGLYIARVAERTGVPRETLEREVAEGRRQAERLESGRPSGPPRREAEAAPLRPVQLGPERNILLLLLRDENWVERAAERISPRDLRDPLYSEIFQELLHLHAEGGRDPAGAWLATLPEELVSRVQELLDDPEGRHISAPEQFFSANLRRILARPYEEKLAEIHRQLEIAPPEHAEALHLEQHEIRITMREQQLLDARLPRIWRSVGKGGR